MSNALQPMSADQRARFAGAYLTWLRARDGVPDLVARRFDVRERFFAGIDEAPCRWVGRPPVDQRVFDRNHARRQPEVGLDPLTLWALATAKTNRAERFGVELSLDNPRRDGDGHDDPHAYIQIEEIYHTRILRDVLATLGLTMEVLPPHPATRALVRAMVHLPEGMANIAVLCGEIVGVAIFTLLLDKARELLTDQPNALSRIEELFAQILVDEVGHVHYIRSTLSDTAIALARPLLPVVVRSVLADIPELGLLCGRDAVLARARAADVDAAEAPFPDRLVFA